MNGARQSGQSGFLPVQKLRSPAVGARSSSLRQAFPSTSSSSFCTPWPGSILPDRPRNRSPGNRTRCVRLTRPVRGTSRENVLREGCFSTPVVVCLLDTHAIRPTLLRIGCTRVRPRNFPTFRAGVQQDERG